MFLFLNAMDVVAKIQKTSSYTRISGSANQPSNNGLVASLSGGQVETRRVAKCRGRVRDRRRRRRTQEGDEDGRLHGVQGEDEKNTSVYSQVLPQQ